MAGPKTEADGRIAKASNGNAAGPASLRAFLTQPAMVREVTNAMPKHLNPDRMLRIVLTALSTTPNLARCTQQSFMGCVLQASQLGLEVNTPLGHAYLIPRENRKREVMECTLLIGYQGMIELALRSGKVTGIKAKCVRAGDHFDYEDGLHPRLSHRESSLPDRELQAITHAWAVAHIRDGEPIFVVLSRAQIDARMQRSSSGKSGPWVSDFEAMAAKSAVRALFRWIPKSPDMALVEHMEETADRGSLQAVAFDADVKNAVARTGIAPIADEDDLPVPTNDFDQETGEVINTTGEPMPAQAAKA
jgi:recombination protein RecT